MLQELLLTENLKALVRAHEEEGDGFKMHMWDKSVKNPVCLTIFSAPNYCYHENEAAVFLVNPGENSKILTYYKSPYEIYYLKNRDDALTIFFPALVEEI